MFNSNWRKRLSYFLKERDGPLSYWDISRVVASVTMHVVVLYLLIGAGLSIWSFYELDRQAYRDYQQQSEREQQQSARKIADRCNVILEPGMTFHDCVLKELLSYQKQDVSDKDLQAQQDMARWAFWMLIPTSVGLPISVGGLWMLWRSLQQTREAISTDREVGHAQVRSYITAEPKELADLVVGRNARVEIHVANTGQSPAYNVRYIAAVFIADHPLPHDIGPMIAPDPNQAPRFGNTVPAQGSFFAEGVGGNPISEHDIRSVVNTDGKRLYVSCVVYYKDVFGLDHETMMTAYLDQTGEPVIDPETGRIGRSVAWMIAPILNHST